jgi:hypothetical protein
VAGFVISIDWNYTVEHGAGQSGGHDMAVMPDTSWPFYPLAFLRDAARCLALVNQSQLSLNPQGRLQVGSVARQLLLAQLLFVDGSAGWPRSATQAAAEGPLLRGSPNN